MTLDILDTSQGLGVLAELARELTGAPVALISIVDDAFQYHAAESGLGEPWAAGRRIPISHSICASVVAGGRPVTIGAMGDDPDFADHPAREEFDIESYCGVPIRNHDGQLLGSFCVVDHSAREWSPETVTTLRRLADLVTTFALRDQFEKQRLVDLQQQVLPKRLPLTPTGTLTARYRPSQAGSGIGGDFYDCLRSSDDAVTVVIGDVVGQGVASTQAAAQLRAATHALISTHDFSPVQIIRELSSMAISIDGFRGARVLVATFSGDGREFRWARAGALPPIMIGSDEARVVDGPVAPPIGIGRIDDSAEVATPLDGLRRILFISDGLVNRRDGSLDSNLDRVARLAADNASLDRLIDECIPSGRQTDDVVVVSWQQGS